MPEERVTTQQCSVYRREIFGMIFPRWALLITLGIIGTIIGIIYNQGAAAARDSVSAMSETNMLDQKFTMTVEHIKETMTEMKEEQREQRALLQKIDKRLNGGVRHE